MFSMLFFLFLLLLFMDLSAFCTVIKMLINLFIICGSFDTDTVICRSFDFSFKYLVQRFTLRFITYRFHYSFFVLFLVLISFFNPTFFSLMASRWYWTRFLRGVENKRPT